MEAQYKCRNGRLLIRVEAGDQKTLFKRIAETEQVFDAASRCGQCSSVDLSFQVRTVRDNSEYFELLCRSCRATMTFGQHRVGNTLYPKQGWAKYTKEDQ